MDRKKTEISGMAMRAEKERISRSRLVKDFKALPWGENHLLALHSSLSSIGLVEGGAATAVDALLSAIGSSTTLMVPTFTYSFSSIGNWPPFDYEKSKSVVGAITESVRLHPQAIRSFHPTHSVAAIGPRAIDLTRAHLAGSPLGVGSPFHRLAQWGGDVMLVGCDHRSNSLLHVAEILANVAYIEVPFTAGQKYETAEIYRDGRQTLELKLFQAPGCSRGFEKARKVLDDAGLIRTGKVGMALVQMFPAEAALKAVVAALKKQPDLLLCDIEDCQICPRRRKALRV